MNCDEFELGLQQRLDGAPAWSDEAAMQDHARSCAVCRELEDGFRLIAHGFVVSRPPQPSPDLTRRILESIRPSAPRRWWLKPAIALAAAASLLFALAWWILPRSGDAAGQPVVAEASPRAADGNASIAPETPATGSTHMAADEPLFPDDDARGEPLLADAVEPVTQIVRAFGRSLGSPVRPIAVGATEMIGNFFKDLPDAEESMMSLPGMPEMKPSPREKMSGPGRS
jgi:hypothetical protein